MKISKSKKELARIISENGGWRDGAYFAVQDNRGSSKNVWFSSFKPTRDIGSDGWRIHGGGVGECLPCSKLISNWHQCILSREEYFHLYPAPDADGWIEWRGGECPVDEGVFVDLKWSDGFEPKAAKPRVFRWQHLDSHANIIAYRLHKPEQSKSTAVGDDETNLAAKEELEAMEYKPTIEQLAADYRNRKDCSDRKQQEADAAKADADAKLAELVAAGKALNLVISFAEEEPELVITDWRDLQVGDIIRCVGDWQGEDTDGVEFEVTDVEGKQYGGELAIRVDVPIVGGTWGDRFVFVRRP